MLPCFKEEEYINYFDLLVPTQLKYPAGGGGGYQAGQNIFRQTKFMFPIFTLFVNLKKNSFIRAVDPHSFVANPDPANKVTIITNFLAFFYAFFLQNFPP